MSAEDQDVTTEETEAPEAAADEADEAAAQVEPEAPEAEAADEEPVAEVAVEAEAEEPVEEPAADEPVAEEPAADEPVAAEAEAADEDPVAEADEPATVGEAFGPVRVARVYVCERGHRTTTLWGSPETCQARPLRSGPECGLRLYHITELPEQVQKALNPLKASKKGSKKK